MDFKVNREMFSTKEVVYDGSIEQSVELDYILPDYFPEVFRVLKCQMSPRIVSHSINGDKLTYELVACVKVIYMSENSTTVRCVEQKMTFSKSVNLSKHSEKCVARIMPKTEYINCRVVNQRRLDLRGVVSTKVRVSGEVKTEVVSDAYGGNIQLKKKKVSYSSNTLTAQKRSTIVEELSMGEVKPEIISIIRSEAKIMNVEQKTITGKVIIKGETVVNMLYSCEKSEENELETMQFNIPFSQIMDVTGITEEYDAMMSMNVVSCEILPKMGENMNMVECEVVLEMSCVANKYEKVDILVDAFSTTNPVDFKFMETKLEMKPEPINMVESVKTNIKYTDGSIKTIYDSWANITSVMSRTDMDKKMITICGTCNIVVMAKNDENCPVYLEHDVPFETEIQMDNMYDNCYADPTACVMNCSYKLTSTDCIEVKVDIKIGGYIYNSIGDKIMTQIEVDSNTKKMRENNHSVKLYFAQEGEEVWEIAKRYSTSIKAIIDENDMMDDSITKKGMILIPMVD